MVFVFGSNEKGEHNGGAAKVAVNQHGAVYNQGFGPQGNTFAIPTCRHSTGRPGFEISLEALSYYIYCFILYAKMHPELEFQVTQIGCGLAGFRGEQVAPLFKDAPANCQFDSAWRDLLPGRTYWGTVGTLLASTPTPAPVVADPQPLGLPASARKSIIDANDVL